MFRHVFGRRPRLATQTLLAQVTVLCVVLGGGLALTAELLRDSAEQNYEQRALAVARSTAENPVVVDRIAAGDDPQGEVQQAAEAVLRRTGMLFVVVTDSRGIRYSHPDPALLGKEVSTAPTALDGRESVAIQRGTLGDSARAKVPLRTADGRVIGEVSTGVRLSTALGAAAPLIREEGAFAGGALLVGAGAAALLTRRLKRQTLGLEPVDLADLLREQQAVLHGVGDGVLAVDQGGRVTVCNAEAARLLDHDSPSGPGTPLPPGTAIAEAGLPPALARILTERQELWQSVLVVGERVLVVTAQPVRRGERNLGHVLTLRDRTELDELARERSALRALSDALRAQAHEYTNRLHTLAGLLDTGATAEARGYLRELAAAPLATEGRDGARLADPYLRGLLAAKAATASEHGVALRLDEDSHLPRRLTDPLDVVSVVGNLLDNAVKAAESGERRPAWVELSVLAEGDTLHVAVLDSGDGVAEADAAQLFRSGFTTRAADERDGHGIGLTLARQLVDKHGGELRLERTGGVGHGAVFVARIPGVLERPGVLEQPGALEQLTAAEDEPAEHEPAADELVGGAR
ncbi:sensor histidine kinase [Kitasatospora kifunensis]|uniref:histidine kinase n=1 Tax=Kitasatospora kifunensis TaxID=58351 RepID=A0A7W7R8C7_KITKI|nr:sensor histidine kinase [Kitasatospora kifunensis]MBB4927332.1 two-component system CitB family sensor kinase [Kitasatospora kifunensis]